LTFLKCQKFAGLNLLSAIVYDSGGVKKIYLRYIVECSKHEDSFHYSIRGSTTKVDDVGVEFLSSDEEN
jgi:hypothetical protein